MVSVLGFIGIASFIIMSPLLMLTAGAYLKSRKLVFRDLSIGVVGGWLGSILLFFVGKWFLKVFFGSYFFPEGPPAQPYVVVYLLSGLFLGGISGVLAGVVASLKESYNVFPETRSLVFLGAGGALTCFGISLFTGVYFLG